MVAAGAMPNASRRAAQVRHRLDQLYDNLVK
jgi:hypothetical protein